MRFLHLTLVVWVEGSSMVWQRYDGPYKQAPKVLVQDAFSVSTGGVTYDLDLHFRPGLLRPHHDD
jgi:hypothetical protein